MENARLSAGATTDVCSSEFKCLLPQHQAYLRDRGITPESAAANWLTSVREIVLDPTTGQLLRGAWVKEWLKWKQPAPELGSALVIPFIGVNGDFVNYAIVRPDRPRLLGVDKRGLRIPGTKLRRAKYELPLGQPGRIYFAQPTDRLLNSHTDLIITESPIKAIAAHQAGYAAIGLNGVAGWSRKRPVDRDGHKLGERELHRGFDKIPLDGRRVYVIFDSDISSKPQVRREADALVAALRGRRADVAIVVLPSEPVTGAKLGLDDYLHAHGAAALKLLIEPVRVAIDARRAARSQAQDGTFASSWAIATRHLSGNRRCYRPVSYDFSRGDGRGVVAWKRCGCIETCGECFRERCNEVLEDFAYYVLRTSVHLAEGQLPRQIYRVAVPECRIDATVKIIGRYDGEYQRVRVSPLENRYKVNADTPVDAVFFVSLPFGVDPPTGFESVSPGVSLIELSEAALQARRQPVEGQTRVRPFSHSSGLRPKLKEPTPVNPCIARGRPVVSREAMRCAAELLGFLDDEVQKPFGFAEDYGKMGYSAPPLQSLAFSLMIRGVGRDTPPTDAQFLDAVAAVLQVPANLAIGEGVRVTETLAVFLWYWSRTYTAESIDLRARLIEANERDISEAPGRREARELSRLSKAEGKRLARITKRTGVAYRCDEFGCWHRCGAC